LLTAVQSEVVSARTLIEREILMDLFAATGGDNWKENKNWGTDKNPKQWYGVSVNRAGEIRGLNLSNNNLVGKIPSSLGELKKLSRLHLWQNSLNGEIPKRFGDLTNLSKLDLIGNNLSGELSLPVIRLIASMRLKWGRQSVYLQSYGHPSVLAGPGFTLPMNIDTLGADITELDLSQCCLIGGIPESIGAMTHLTQLFLSKNMLTGAIPASLARLKNLSVLSIGCNQLSGELCLPVIEFISKLRDRKINVAFYYNEQPAAPRGFTLPANIGDLDPEMTVLDLSSCCITGEIPQSLVRLSSQLTALVLSRNALSGKGFEHVCYLKQLKFLFIEKFWTAFRAIIVAAATGVANSAAGAQHSHNHPLLMTMTSPFAPRVPPPRDLIVAVTREEDFNDSALAAAAATGIGSCSGWGESLQSKLEYLREMFDEMAPPPV